MEMTDKDRISEIVSSNTHKFSNGDKNNLRKTLLDIWELIKCCYTDEQKEEIFKLLELSYTALELLMVSKPGITSGDEKNYYNIGLICLIYRMHEHSNDKFASRKTFAFLNNLIHFKVCKSVVGIETLSHPVTVGVCTALLSSIPNYDLYTPMVLTKVLKSSSERLEAFEEEQRKIVEKFLWLMSYQMQALDLVRNVIGYINQKDFVNKMLITTDRKEHKIIEFLEERLVELAEYQAKLYRGEEEEIIMKCKLHNGNIYRYDVYNSERNTTVKEYQSLEYLGLGVIYSINGVMPKNDKQYHFWRKK